MPSVQLHDLLYYERVNRPFLTFPAYLFLIRREIGLDKNIEMMIVNKTLLILVSINEFRSIKLFTSLKPTFNNNVCFFLLKTTTFVRLV